VVTGGIALILWCRWVEPNPSPLEVQPHASDLVCELLRDISLCSAKVDSLFFIFAPRSAPVVKSIFWDHKGSYSQPRFSRVALTSASQEHRYEYLEYQH